jgi:threonine dehydrogenase-like Zn-dependent dehydrogenase
MREAVTVAPFTVEIREAPEPPAPGPDEALLAIAAVGICGSDLEMFKGTDPYSRFPCRQGHEYSAHVLEFGPGYSGPLTVGDLVAVDPMLPCGDCIACRRGRSNCCVNLRVTGGQIDGAFIDQFVMPVANLHRATDLSASEAAFVEPVSIGLQMVNRSGLGPGDHCVVFGAGPIGQSVILAARDRGARLMCVDLLQSRLDLATELGVEATVDASARDVGDAVSLWTNGDGPVVAFEATGATTVLRKALEIVAHAGTVVVAGTPTEEVSFPALWIVKKELDVLGSRNSLGLFGSAVDLVRRHRSLVQRLITHTYPLEGLQAAMEFAIANPAIAEKVVIAVSSGNEDLAFAT